MLWANLCRWVNVSSRIVDVGRFQWWSVGWIGSAKRVLSWGITARKCFVWLVVTFYGLSYRHALISGIVIGCSYLAVVWFHCTSWWSHVDGITIGLACCLLLVIAQLLVFHTSRLSLEVKFMTTFDILNSPELSSPPSSAFPLSTQ